MRKIDKTKKSNIKCEHCKHWSGWASGICSVDGKEEKYYKRCKNFCWAIGEKYEAGSLEVNEPESTDCDGT